LPREQTGFFFGRSIPVPRSSSYTTAKSISLSFTSGGSTVIPIARASATVRTTLSVLSLSALNVAHTNSTG